MLLSEQALRRRWGHSPLLFSADASLLPVAEQGAFVRIRDEKRQDPKFGSCRNVIQGSVVAGKVDAVVGMVSGEPYFT